MLLVLAFGSFPVVMMEMCGDWRIGVGWNKSWEVNDRVTG